jgi:hypothetical protein
LLLVLEILLGQVRLEEVNLEEVNLEVDKYPSKANVVRRN